MVKEQRVIPIGRDEVEIVRVWVNESTSIFMSIDDTECGDYVWINMSIPEAKKVCLALRHFIDGACDERQTD